MCTDRRHLLCAKPSGQVWGVETYVLTWGSPWEPLANPCPMMKAGVWHAGDKHITARYTAATTANISPKCDIGNVIE